MNQPPEPPQPPQPFSSPTDPRFAPPPPFGVQYGAPQPGGPFTAGPQASAPAAPGQPPHLPAPASTRLLKRLLLIATCVSLASAACFIAYLALPHLVSSQRGKHIHVLFILGLVGLVVSEVCQFLGVFVLIGQWISRERTWRKFREIVVLFIAIFPYVVIALFVVTLVVYLRARRRNPASERAQQAKEDLKEKATNMLVDQVANQSGSVAAPPIPQPVPASLASLGRPPMYTMGDAVGRVVGPSTQRSLSDAGGGLAGVTMVAVVLATIAVLGALSPLNKLSSVQLASGTVPTATAGATATATPSGSLTLAANSNPSSITLGPDGNLWFTDPGTQQIGRITPAGVVTEFAAPTGSLGLGTEYGSIVKGPDGNIWFTEPAYNAIGQISPSGTIQRFPIPTSGGTPEDITVGPDGNLWFTDGGLANAIGKVTPSGVFQDFPLPTKNEGPGGITVGPDGNLWFIEGGFLGVNQRIARITTAGAIQEFPLPNNNSEPIAIVAGPDGNLWFTAVTVTGGFVAGDEIGRMTPSGALTTFTTPADGYQPNDITVGPDGNLWFTELGNRIARITPAGSIQEFPISTSEVPGGIITGPDGNLWYCTNSNGGAAIEHMAP